METNQAAVSQSVSADSTAQNIALESSKGSIDEMFPLFLQIFQQVKIPVPLLQPFLVWFFFQALLVSIWPWSDYWKEHNEHNVMNWLRTVMYFIPDPYEPVNYLIVAVVFTIFNILSFILIRFQISYYNMKRKFVSILNYPIRAYFDTILVVIFVPSIIHEGETFLLLCHGNTDPMIIVSFILYLISIVYNTYSFILVQGFASKSIIVNPTPLLNFDPSIMGITIAVLVVTEVPYFLLSLFEGWAQIVIFVLHIFLNCFLIWYFQSHVPFVDTQTNSLSSGWQVGCIAGDVISIVCYFKRDINYLVPILVALCFFIGTVPFWFVIFTIKSKIVLKQLSNEVKTQEEAYEYYKELGLDHNRAKALVYLKAAFQNYSPAFYNWHLVNFIADNYDDELSISTCLQLVNFFPKETRLQNKLQRILIKRRSCGYITRFLLFQVDAIKILRQFSVSTASKLKLIELKTMSHQCENMTKAALESVIKPDYFEALASKTQMARAVWQETIQNSPNNPKFCEEFSRYLIDCECDFPEGLKMKNKQQIIEMGSNFTVDYSFRSMVTGFPRYITDQILDLQGGVIKKMNNAAKGSSSLSNNSNNSNNSAQSGTLDDEITDADLEDYIGKQTIKLARTRLALHRALENKIPGSIKAVLPATAFIVLYIIVIVAVSLYYASSQIKHVGELMHLLDYISQTRFYTGISNIALITDYFYETGKIARYAIVILKLTRPDDTPYIVFAAKPELLPQIVGFTTGSTSNLQKLLSSIVDLATEGEDVYTFAKELLLPTLDFHVCMKPLNYSIPTGLNLLDRTAPPEPKVHASLTSLISLFNVNQREYSGKASALDAMSSEPTCELTVNFQIYYAGVTRLFNDITKFQSDKGKDLNHKFKVLSITIPVVTFIVVFVPVFIIHFLTVRSMNQLIEIIKSFDAKAKMDAKESLMVVPPGEEIRVAEVNSKSSTSIVLMIIACIISLIFLAITLVGWFMTSNTNNTLVNISAWNQYACNRLSLAAEVMNMLVTEIVIKDIPESTKLTNTTAVGQVIKLLLAKLTEVENKLVNGDGTIPSCNGFDKILDQLNVIDKELPNKVNEQAYYDNASLHTQIDLLRQYVTNILTSVDLNATINAYDVANAFHLANSRMFSKLMNVTQRLLVIADEEETKLHQLFYIIIAITIVSIIAFVITCVSYYNVRVSAYKAALFVIKRFSPYQLINNKLFNKIFLKGNTENKNEKLSIEGSIIKNANDSIFCTSIIGIVEIVNNSVSTLLGYTPEQILGQRVSEFFTSKDGEAITTKMEMMKSGQASAFYEDDYYAVSDSLQEIPVHVSIIGMKKEGDHDVNSFVLVLRDQTALVNQKKAAEEAKAKSEKLLYQILPRDIVVQLNRGEKDISFVVPSATIIFIDINRFSEYAANLSPQDIMANLSYYFAQLDKLAAKYNMITKIKLIGDIYMAATGLFNPDVAPDTHAEQTILFGLDCVTALEEVNVKLEANLAIRVGINSGGPVIAGVLGTDKPVFDIIGDPINVAARLQSTDEINHIHISQATYDLIKGMNFEITQRGETFLKGKGKQMTYYVAHTGSQFNTLE